MELSKEEIYEINEIVKSQKSGQQMVFRARIIIMLEEGYRVTEIAEELETTRKTVMLWGRHWEERKHLAVKQRLADEQRPGAPATITAEQWCQIMALACSAPSESGRPISHWTPRELAEEAIKRGIVETISTRHVGRFLKSGRVEATQKSILAK